MSYIKVLHCCAILYIKQHLSKIWNEFNIQQRDTGEWECRDSSLLLDRLTAAWRKWDLKRSVWLLGDLMQWLNELPFCQLIKRMRVVFQDDFEPVLHPPLCHSLQFVTSRLNLLASPAPTYRTPAKDGALGLLLTGGSESPQEEHSALSPPEETIPVYCWLALCSNTHTTLLFKMPEKDLVCPIT